jgi:hypothetical protein
METTKNEMPLYAKQFFDNLRIYLDTPIYFYGSIQRNDYFTKSSDIDVDIFTSNESSTISKLQNFLGVNKYEFKKIVYKLDKKDKLIYGKKVKYEDPDNNFSTEISIYKEDDKLDILNVHRSKMILPFYISFILIFLKFLYYNLGILSKKCFLYLKNFVMSSIGNSNFLVADLPKPKDEATQNS